MHASQQGLVHNIWLTDQMTLLSKVQCIRARDMQVAMLVIMGEGTGHTHDAWVKVLGIHMMHG